MLVRSSLFCSLSFPRDLLAIYASSTSRYHPNQLAPCSVATFRLRLPYRGGSSTFIREVRQVSQGGSGAMPTKKNHNLIIAIIMHSPALKSQLGKRKWGGHDLAVQAREGGGGGLENILLDLVASLFILQIRDPPLQGDTIPGTTDGWLITSRVENIYTGLNLH